MKKLFFLLILISGCNGMENPKTIDFIVDKNREVKFFVKTTGRSLFFKNIETEFFDIEFDKNNSRATYTLKKGRYKLIQERDYLGLY